MRAKPHLHYLVFGKCRTRRRHRSAATYTQSTRKCGQTAACGRRRAAHKWMHGAGFAFALDAQRRARTANNSPCRAIQAGSEQRRSITAARSDGTCETTTPRRHGQCQGRRERRATKAEGGAERHQAPGQLGPAAACRPIRTSPPPSAAPAAAAAPCAPSCGRNKLRHRPSQSHRRHRAVAPRLREHSPVPLRATGACTEWAIPKPVLRAGGRVVATAPAPLQRAGQQHHHHR